MKPKLKTELERLERLDRYHRTARNVHSLVVQFGHSTQARSQTIESSFAASALSVPYAG